MPRSKNAGCRLVPLPVGQDGIFYKLPWKYLFSQTGDEYDIEGQPARHLNRPNKDAAIAPALWWDAQFAEPWLQHELYCVEVYRPYGRHRFQLSE
jgi:hypothetical protein